MDDFFQLPLVNLAAGALVTYLLAVRRSRREDVDRIFLEAMAGVVQLQATRFIESNVPADLVHGSKEQVDALKAEVQSESFKAFIVAARETRLRLAAAYPYCPEVRSFVERFEVAPDEVDFVLALLERGQRRARHTWRVRRYRALRERDARARERSRP